MPILPFFNFAVFFIRFAGVINSIDTKSTWKTKDLTEERQAFGCTLYKEWAPVISKFTKIKNYIDGEENEAR